MVVAPALHRGKATNSQMVMRVRLNVTPMSGGDYEARFVGIDSTPVPMGNWYWTIGDGRYALADYQSQARHSGDRHRGNTAESRGTRGGVAPVRSPSSMPSTTPASPPMRSSSSNSQQK